MVPAGNKAKCCLPVNTKQSAIPQKQLIIITFISSQHICHHHHHLMLSKYIPSLCDRIHWMLAREVFMKTQVLASVIVSKEVRHCFDPVRERLVFASCFLFLS